MNQDKLTTREAAKAAGVSLTTIRSAISKGDLAAAWYSRGYLIDSHSLAEWSERRRKGEKHMGP